MTRLVVCLVAVTLLCAACNATPQVHKLMTSDQLQSVFHVEDHDSVPNYEIIKVTHNHGVQSHQVHKRSVDSNTLNLSEQKLAANTKEVHHVKKDLSKTSYYSELKNAAAANQTAAVKKKLKNFQVDSDLNKNVNESDKNLKNSNHLDLSSIKEHQLSFSAFGENHNLTLKRTDGLFKDGPHAIPMWMAVPEPNSTQGIEYEQINDDGHTEEEVGSVFQDEQNMAAILMRRQLETGDLIMEGSIGHELVIKPLPHALSPNPREAHHVIYKRSTDPTDQLSDFALMEPDRLQKRYRDRQASSSQSQSVSSDNVEDDSILPSASDDALEGMPSAKRSKRAVPHVIYPEILVIVDYDGYRLHGGDNLQVKRYFVSFWNGVDLRYRLLKGPRIRISIAGIIISRGRDATPYLERNRVGRDAIDSAAALTDMGKYLFRERRLPVYDIAVAITKYDMCRRRKGGRCTKGTAGFAYVGGACVVNKRLEKVNSVAIIEDTGGFSGIIVAAHEVGHLLGAVHDGSPPPSYLGGPGAEKCRWEDGYIMSDLRHTERGFRWSPCTVQSFHHFLNGDTASCLHNAPHEDSALGRSLPGTLLSLDAQCRRDRGTYACFKDDRVCAQLFCFDSLTGYCVAYRPAAEGSTCGSGLHCLDGRCVTQNENVIPDYASQTPNFANSNVYNPVYNDEEDYEEPTTPSTTTTTQAAPTTRRTTTPTPPTTTTTIATTTTTTQPKTTKTKTTITPTPKYYTQFKNRIEKSITTERINNLYSTKKVDVQTISSTTKKPSGINPFYYGFTKFSTKAPVVASTTKRSTTSKSYSKSTSTSPPTTTVTVSTTKTTKRPQSTNKYRYNNKNTKNVNNSGINRSTTTSTTKTTPTTTSTTVSPEIITSTTPFSAKRNEFFESYLKKLATTTRSPYNFDNFGIFFKSTTTQTPSYASNFLGDNSQHSPVNVTMTRRRRL